MIINIVSLEAFVSRTIHCFLGNMFVKGVEISRKTDDVIQGRILLSQTFVQPVGLLDSRRKIGPFVE